MLSTGIVVTAFPQGHCECENHEVSHDLEYTDITLDLIRFSENHYMGKVVWNVWNKYE